MEDILNELVGGDMLGGNNDKAVISNSEIQTGPLDKHFTDKSDYEKGMQVTTDRVASRYRQNLPWFAIYNYGSRNGLARMGVNEVKDDLMEKIFKKMNLKNSGLIDKEITEKTSEVLELIKDKTFTKDELENIIKFVKNLDNE